MQLIGALAEIAHYMKHFSTLVKGCFGTEQKLEAGMPINNGVRGALDLRRINDLKKVMRWYCLSISAPSWGACVDS